MKFNDGVTVIIPVYNSEKYLNKCIDSVINQSYKNWQLILVDDGSTDNSSSICDKYANEYDNISVIHKENGGVSSARNAGIDRVTTKYFVFIDSDDYTSCNYLQTLTDLSVFYNDKGHFWTKFVTSKNQEFKTSTEEYEFYNLSDILDLIGYVYIQPPYCKLYNTELVINNEIRMNENLSLGEDLIFNIDYLKASENDEIVVSTKLTYFYNDRDEESLNSKYRKDYYQIIKFINNYIYDLISNKLQNDELIEQYYNYSISTYYNVFHNTMSVKNNDSLIKKIRYNNSIMRDENFKKALVNSDCYINPVVKLGYKVHNYLFVLLAEKIAKMKSIIRKRND